LKFNLIIHYLVINSVYYYFLKIKLQNYWNRWKIVKKKLIQNLQLHNFNLFKSSFKLLKSKAFYWSIMLLVHLCWLSSQRYPNSSKHGILHTCLTHCSGIKANFFQSKHVILHTLLPYLTTIGQGNFRRGFKMQQIVAELLATISRVRKYNLHFKKSDHWRIHRFLHLSYRCNLI